MKEADTITMPDNMPMFDKAPKMPFCLTFSDGDRKICSLSIVNGQLRFEGNADESAKVFFEYITKLWGDR